MAEQSAYNSSQFTVHSSQFTVHSSQLTAHSSQLTAHSHSYPLISVIVPVYNVDRYLVRCVDSIINQTYKNLEIILVDDGSTDKSPQICDSYLQKDTRIRVVHKQNGGLSSARNAGLDTATGEYIAFVDSDDYILPEMYEVLFRLIDENNADMAVSSYQKVDEAGIPLQSKNTNGKDEVLSGDEVLSIGMKDIDMMACSKLYKSSIFDDIDDIRFPEGRLHEDEFTTHHILSKCSRIVSTSARMYMYTQRAGSIMGTAEESFIVKRLDDAVYAFKDRYNFFCSMGRKDLAGLAAASSNGVLCRLLRRISYMKNFRLCNKAAAFTISACLKSGGLMNKLRPAKLLLVVAHNILRDCWRVTKKLPRGLKNRLSYILRTRTLKS